MAEINIKIVKLNEGINKLKELRTKCTSLETKPPETKGGGKTVNELEQIAESYVAINKSFEVLTSNTIKFLQNVRDSYVTSDTKAADKISGR